MNDRTPTQFMKKIRVLIINNELDEALKTLRAFLNGSPKLNEAIQQSARYQRVKEQIRLGTIRHEDANVDINQITASILGLLTDLDEAISANTDLQEETQQATTKIVNSKNVVSNSTITAGGNVHIGDKAVKNSTQNAEKIYNIDHIDNANFS